MCFTEDGSGLDKNIEVMKLKHKWAGWWSKVHIFCNEYYKGREGRVLYVSIILITDIYVYRLTLI
jgi:hypothetical protein